MNIDKSSPEKIYIKRGSKAFFLNDIFRNQTLDGLSNTILEMKSHVPLDMVGIFSYERHDETCHVMFYSFETDFEFQKRQESLKIPLFEDK